MNAIPIAGPAVEPLTVLEMRAFLRLDDAAEDDLVATLVRTARHCVEEASGRRLIAQTWRLALDRWPDDRLVRVPLSPLIAVEGIKVFDAGGLATVVAPALYRVDAETDPARIVVDPAAPIPGRSSHGVEIEVRVGYGAGAEAVPAPLRHAVRMLVARWFEHRGDAPDTGGPMPPDVLALIAPFRRARL
jgi:uncharacterized phiE125 gp8 family phage protein